MRTLTRSRDRKLLGVAGGMAEYFDMDKSIWRLIWILSCVFMPPAILAYFILGAVLPSARPEVVYPDPARTAEAASDPAPGAGAAGSAGDAWSSGPATEPPRHAYKRMTRSNDRWLAGVAGGIAQYLDTDPIAIRAAFLIAFFVFGTGLLAYIILAIIMPGPDRSFR